MNDLTPSEDPSALLAYYDARGVDDTQLCRIFSCAPGDLANARATEEYRNALAEHTTERVTRATETDDKWDTLEHSALGTLQESMMAINDPRMLLGIAVQANKAGRRRGGLTPKQSNAPAEIQVPTEAGQSKIVRLRARFVEALEDPNGARRIIDRQIEIQTGNAQDLKEDLTPQEVKGILRNSIGVDPDQLSVRTHRGPDQDLGTMLDFSRIGEEWTGQ
jgi:hypothetical protein